MWPGKKEKCTGININENPARAILSGRQDCYHCADWRTPCWPASRGSRTVECSRPLAGPSGGAGRKRAGANCTRALTGCGGILPRVEYRPRSSAPVGAAARHARRAKRGPTGPKGSRGGERSVAAAPYWPRARHAWRQQHPAAPSSACLASPPVPPPPSLASRRPTRKQVSKPKKSSHPKERQRRKSYSPSRP